MRRRDFITSTTLAAATLAAAQTTEAADMTSPKPSDAGSLALPKLDHRKLVRPIPVNKPRAMEALRLQKIDAFIALRPHNVYYLTNADPVLTAFNVQYPAFAVFSADASQPIVFLGSTGSAWELGRDGREKPEAIMAMTAAKNWEDYIDASPAKMKIEPQSYGADIHSAVTGGPYTEREAWWVEAQTTINPTAAPSPAWGLVHALKQLGVTRGVVATDDMRVAYLLGQIGFDACTIVPGDNLMRQIRQVKTDHEIELMRVAQKATQDSIMAATSVLEVGMTYDDFRRQFFTEAQARDCTPSFVLFGVTQGMLPDPTVTAGRCYMIDSSAKFHHYMGDFARTLTVGEPSKLALQRFKAQQVGREAGLNAVKPGVRRSVVEAACRSAMIKAGMPEQIISATTLHSVGLEHADEPIRSDTAYYATNDYVLQPNMALTLDVPFIEVGWGAGHNEDMIRVTSTGFEFMNDTSHPLIVV